MAKMAKPTGSTKWIGLGILILFGFMAYKLYARPTVQDCLELGSDARATRCLEEIGELYTKSNASDPLPFEYLHNLELHNPYMEEGYIPVFSATLKNFSPNSAADVYARITFHPAGTKSCNESASDTQYVKVADFIAPGDSLAIKTNISTNFDTINPYVWCSQVYSADAVK